MNDQPMLCQHLHVQSIKMRLVAKIGNKFQVGLSFVLNLKFLAKIGEKGIVRFYLVHGIVPFKIPHTHMNIF